MLINIFLLIIKTTEEEKRIKDEAYLKEIREELIENKRIFEEIYSDFEKMEEIFNNKFDDLIDEYFIKIPYDIEHKKQKMTGQGLPNVFSSNKYLITPIIRDIFLKYFFDFYDEYSYRINYKFSNIDLCKLKNKINNFKKSTSLPLINKQNIELNNDILTYKYLDLYYFIEKLEDKINKRCNISIEKIRTSLYGKPFEDILCEEIQDFYYEIKYIRKNFSFDGLRNYKEERIMLSSFNNKLLEEYYKDYSTDIKKLYEYHINTNPVTKADKARFKLLEELLKQYNGDFKELYNKESHGFIKERSYYNNIEEIRNKCFLYIWYSPKSKNYFIFNNDYISFLYLIESINKYNEIN